MKNNLIYFRDHVRSNLKALFYFSAVSLAFSSILGYRNQVYRRHTWYENGIHGYDDVFEPTLYISVVILCILCYIIPVYQFSCFKKRKNLDCWYSVPVTRTALGVIHYITGLLMVVITFSLCYLQNYLMLVVRGADLYFAPMIPHFFLCVLMGFVMYSFFVFIFNQANTTADGCIFLALWTYVFFLVTNAIRSLTNINIFELRTYGIPWNILDTLTYQYEVRIENGSQVAISFFNNGFSERVLWFVFWIVIGLLSAVGFLLSFGKRRPEKTEELSDSFFGYRVLIPVFAVTGMMYFDEFALWIIIDVLAFVGYTIYRRGFHYKKTDIAVLLVLLGFTFLEGYPFY